MTITEEFTQRQHAGSYLDVIPFRLAAYEILFRYITYFENKTYFARKKYIYFEQKTYFEQKHILKKKHMYFEQKTYTQYPIIRNGLIRNTSEI